MNKHDLSKLDDWCRAHCFRRLRTLARAGSAEITIEPANGPRSWRRVIVEREGADLRLCDSDGSQLVAGSSLTPLLDVLDASLPTRRHGAHYGGLV